MGLLSKNPLFYRRLLISPFSLIPYSCSTWTIMWGFLVINLITCWCLKSYTLSDLSAKFRYGITMWKMVLSEYTGSPWALMMNCRSIKTCSTLITPSAIAFSTRFSLDFNLLGEFYCKKLSFGSLMLEKPAWSMLWFTDDSLFDCWLKTLLGFPRLELNSEYPSTLPTTPSRSLSLKNDFKSKFSSALKVISGLDKEVSIWGLLNLSLCVSLIILYLRMNSSSLISIRPRA